MAIICHISSAESNQNELSMYMYIISVMKIFISLAIIMWCGRRKRFRHDYIHERTYNLTNLLSTLKAQQILVA